MSVLLVDDHAVVREGIRLLLSACPARTRVVGEASTIAEARQHLATTPVDVALLDVMLPDGDGIQLCREIRQVHPETACVILTSHPDPHLVLAATLAGAADHLSKDATPDRVWAAVLSAARGERRLDDAAMAAALDSLVHESGSVDEMADLTDQEHRVFALVGEGLSNREIAEQLHLTEKTVKNYLSRVLAKLGMRRRTQAAVLAARLSERRAPGAGTPPPKT